MFGKKVEAVAHLAFDNPFEFGAQNNVLELVGLGSSVQKVDLGGLGMDLPAQKDEFDGCPVVHEPLRVVLAKQMAEPAGRLVDPEVGQPVQMDD